jgi:hypothetical protein
MSRRVYFLSIAVFFIFIVTTAFANDYGAVRGIVHYNADPSN